MTKLRALAVAAVALYSATAMAGEIAPADVKIDDHKVAESVSGAPGNAEEGAKIFKDAKGGNCLACHANKAMIKDLFHGNVGPALDGAGTRYAPEQIRAILVNSKAVFGPETTMPGFYSLEVGANVRKDLAGKTVLTAQQVEDVVAYVSTLKE